MINIIKNNLFFVFAVFLLMTNRTNAFSAKDEKSRDCISVIKKILSNTNKATDTYKIGLKIDSILIKSDTWNKDINDTIYLYLCYSQGSHVFIRSREYAYEIYSLSDSRTQTHIIPLKKSVDPIFNKIKLWDNKIFKKWKVRPSGNDITHYRLYRIIRKRKNKYKYSFYSYWDHATTYEICNTYYPDEIKVIDY